MLTKLLGFTLITSSLADWWYSWQQYRKQKLLETRDGKLISLHWAHKLEYGKLPRGKIRYVKQSLFEHLPRFWRPLIGVPSGLILMSLPI